MTSPAVEDLQPIAALLNEASQKIYEAVQLAAQLKLKPQKLSNICNVVEHIETVQLDLLEAAKRPSLRGDNHPPMHYPRVSEFEIPAEAVEEMRREFLTQMELNRRPPSIGMMAMSGRRLGDMESQVREKVRADIEKTAIEKRMTENCHAMQDGDNL